MIDAHESCRMRTLRRAQRRIAFDTMPRGFIRARHCSGRTQFGRRREKMPQTREQTIALCCTTKKYFFFSKRLVIGCARPFQPVRHPVDSCLPASRALAGHSAKRVHPDDLHRHCDRVAKTPQRPRLSTFTPAFRDDRPTADDERSGIAVKGVVPSQQQRRFIVRRPSDRFAV